MNFPNVTTLALGDFLDLTVVYDSDVQGGLNWTVAGNTWNPLGYSTTGGTGFTWNGVDDVGVYITQNGMNNNGPGGFHRAAVEPFRWWSHNYQDTLSSGPGTYGAKIQVSCLPGAASSLTLTANNTPSTGDLQLAVTNVPAPTLEGWTFLSADTTFPAGSGYAFGLWPDGLTFALLTLFPTASPGDPVHWTWPVSSPLYPADNANFPPGSFPAFLYGTSWDFVVLAIQPGPVAASNVARVSW
jgi:hypothetical protein